MYQFTDAIDKVKFDEEFSDVADNIKNDCKQLESMSFSDAVIKINEWIDKVFSPCKCSIIDYPEWFKIVVWRIIYNELKTNPQARQTELIEDNINLPKDVFGKKYWNMYSPDMKLQQEEYDNLFLPFNYAQVECNHIYRAMIHHIICSAVVPTDTIVDVFGKLGLVLALCANGYKNKKVCVNEREYIVDIAMVGSLCKKGEFHNLLNDYGLVIIDECHHSASETIANVLKEVKARYVYGVTATPKRGDGLEKINYMLIGPIRYSYTAKEKAMEQGIQHLVYPRFTRTVPPRGVLIGKMHPNEAYEIIHNNDIRDEQIVEDVKNCVSAGRTPVVLSRYKDHSEKLYERLKDYADHVFLMTGNNSKKEHKKILEQMHQVDKAESLILIATGSLVGEGFDFPRLDTLFMATPVSFRGVVEQYAGRLNRDYAGKENVIIYDYVDNHITMFNNMYMKRLKAYKQIGYEIAGGLHNDKQTANAIYDGDNYAENYHKDLLDANKNIIISSPAISGTKVYELINLLKEKQLSGVQITIVTWAPDSYGFGDASYWMQLHEEMRKAGFYIKTVEESCERFAVIDQEVVWYGNINLLAKDKVDDSIMRVLSKEIASELMEITFGDNG